MFVWIKERRQGPGILSFSVVIGAFISLNLMESKAAAEYKAGLSLRLSQAICTSTAEYASSNTIQGPLDDVSKFSTRSKPSCETVMWTGYCEPDVTCQSFECSSSPPPPEILPRIIGGTNAKPNEFPHQVYFKHPDLFCGGSILTANYVITAAQCFYKKDISNFTVVAGGHDLSRRSPSEQERSLKKVIVHQAYIQGPERNDICLVEVDPPFQLTADIQPVVLPVPNYNMTGSAIVTGWGSKNANDSHPDTLQKLTVPIITNIDCADAFETKGNITSTMLCSGIVFIGGDGGNQSCQGDSGGPLTTKMANGSYMLVGIISWGLFCADSNWPGVYTDVSEFLEWITDSII